jgi:hypothetical protein
MIEGGEGYAELARLRGTDDPERDSRREAYRERERRRAARALDRYIETLKWPFAAQPPTGVAGERFVEAVGDYVLSRMQVPMDVSDLRGELYVGDSQSDEHHYGDYGATDDPEVERERFQ